MNKILNKIPVDISNDFCPQTLFLYGTYRDDGTPNFGLFCWFSYCWDTQLGVMACIGGPKLTKDLILKNGVFSANLVTKPLLPLADYLGSNSGYESGKMAIPIETARGAVLNVPLLGDSPVSFELEVSKTVSLDDSIVLLCKIRNVMADERLKDEGQSVLERILREAPVYTTCQTYFSITGERLGGWGEWKDYQKR